MQGTKKHTSCNDAHFGGGDLPCVLAGNVCHNKGSVVREDDRGNMPGVSLQHSMGTSHSTAQQQQLLLLARAASMLSHCGRSIFSERYELQP